MGLIPSLIFAVAIIAVALVALRPKGIPVWIWPLTGAAIMLIIGAEPVGRAAMAIARQWNILLFIAGLMGISAAAESSGVLLWITDTVAVLAGGSRQRLFIWLYAAGAATTILLSNDAAAIVLTPIVYAAVSRRGVNPMPYLFACAFVSNAASFGLPFSNPANLVILSRPALASYVLHMGVPQVLTIVMLLATMLLIFRKALRGRYDPAIPAPLDSSARRMLLVFCALAFAYVAALAVRWPLGPIAAAGAVVSIALSGASPVTFVRRLSWGTLALVAALFVLLDAVARGGFISWAQTGLQNATEHGNVAAIAWTATGAAALSNALNNLPVAIVSSYVAAKPATAHLAYPAIVGVDLGPNLTTAGSLSTLLWLDVLDRRGVRVKPTQYLLLGLATAPPAIAVAVAWLALLR